MHSALNAKVNVNHGPNIKRTVYLTMKVCSIIRTCYSQFSAGSSPVVFVEKKLNEITDVRHNLRDERQMTYLAQ